MSAGASITFRNTRLLFQFMRASIMSLPRAEKSDDAASISNLFHILSYQIRALSVDPICILNGHLVTLPDFRYTARENKE